MSGRRSIQLFRLATLFVPSALAWNEAFSARHASLLVEAVGHALVPLWLLTTAGMLGRIASALHAARRAPRADLGVLDRVDVLTASGSGLAWASAASIMASVWIGWASLAVVGLVGTAVLHLAVLWTLWIAGGADPFRRAAITRRFVPAIASEGEPVIEEIRVDGARVPAGFRLFLAGRVGPRWPLSRHVIEDAESAGEVVLESDVGPALRGEHRAEPMGAWLEDVLGLTRSVCLSVAEATLLVLPRAREVAGVEALLDQGGVDREPRPAERLPTEGTFKLREYQPGDDVRRIHWVRSLSARQIVVRLPDELPPDRPRVRVALDTWLPLAGTIADVAGGELLDQLVGVWLGVAEALARAGAQVTLVAAAEANGKLAVTERRLALRALGPAQKLGARVAWQEEIAVPALLGGGATVVVSCRLQPDPEGARAPRWIVVPRALWAKLDLHAKMTAPGVLPFAMGSADNRWSRRRREDLRRERLRLEGDLLARLTADTAPPRRGTFVARRLRAGVTLEACS